MQVPFPGFVYSFPTVIYSQNTLAVLAPHVPITKPGKTFFNWAALLSPCLTVSDSFSCEHKVNQVSQRSGCDLSHASKSSEKWWSLRTMSCRLFVPSCLSCASFPVITFQCCSGKHWEHEAISQNWFKIFRQQNRVVGKDGTGWGKSLPQSGAISSGNQRWAPAGVAWPSVLHPPPLLGCPWERAVLPLSSQWVQGHWLECLPTQLADLLVPKASLFCNAATRSSKAIAVSQQWGWQSWAQGVVIKEGILLSFHTTGPWAQWMAWPLLSLFHFAFVSTVRDVVHPEISFPASQFSGIATELWSDLYSWKQAITS